MTISRTLLAAASILVVALSAGCGSILSSSEITAARGALVLGDGAAALVSATGEGEAGDGSDAPLEAYAAAALRLRGAAPRPAPRYLRPPAAAPMAPPPPMIG